LFLAEEVVVFAREEAEEEAATRVDIVIICTRCSPLRIYRCCAPFSLAQSFVSGFMKP